MRLVPELNSLYGK